MATKHHKRPPLHFIAGFDAAARNLSFTRAAAELGITQSAVSKQIKALERFLGVDLFMRRTRAIALTEEGQAFHAAATELTDSLRQAMEKIRAGKANVRLDITASTAFASLWLIPRLKRFTRKHPNVDVRVSATVETLNLEQNRLDLAIRYCKPGAAPEGAVRLFDHVTYPVCSPALLKGARKLKRPEDLRRHTLLHTAFPGGRGAYVDWESWLAAAGLRDLSPAGALYFNHYEQMIQAACDGQGVALGLSTLVGDLLRAGKLVKPFDITAAESRACYVVISETGAAKPQAMAFVRWLADEAKSEAPSTSNRD